MELQMILCNRAYGLKTDIVSGGNSRTANREDGGKVELARKGEGTVSEDGKKKKEENLTKKKPLLLMVFGL